MKNVKNYVEDVDGLRCGVGSARSKKEAKEQAAALALRALAREPPRDL